MAVLRNTNTVVFEKMWSDQLMVSRVHRGASFFNNGLPMSGSVLAAKNTTS